MHKMSQDVFIVQWNIYTLLVLTPVPETLQVNNKILKFCSHIAVLVIKR